MIKCFKFFKINYGTIPAFSQPRQLSNGIKNEVVYAGISLPPRKAKGEFCSRINKENNKLVFSL